MGWVKRNLLFLVGGLVSLLLLGGAGFYLFTRVQQNKELSGQIDQLYADAAQNIGTKPGPGSGKVDNIATAKEQVGQMHQIIAKQQSFFRPISPIPASAADTNGLSDHDFASSLRDTISQMQQAAANSSVQLPPRYDFSFSAIKSKITFAPGSLVPLAYQLGEVKTIADIVFRARVNSLDSLRRVRVSPDDKDAPDYLETPSVTNDLAVIEPFEIVVRGFSGELAALLAGFANSTNGFRIKTVVVDPAGGGMPMPAGTPEAAPVTYVPAPSAPARYPGAPNGYPGLGEDAPSAPVAVAVAMPTAARGGLQTVINEHPMKMTLIVELVKLKTPAK